MLVAVEKPIGRFFHQPWEAKRYRVDYGKNLVTSEVIQGVEYLIDVATSPPLAVSNSAIAPDGKSVTFFVGGGVDGQTYKVSVRATTNAGQKFEDEIEYVIQER